MTPTPKPHEPVSLELHRIDSANWVIRDHAFPETDARNVIACVHEAEEDELEVIWLGAGIPLPTRYRYGGDVLEDLERWRTLNCGAQRPTRIPHYRPLVAGGVASTSVSSPDGDIAGEIMLASD
jgi:hypothetical protein